MKIAIIGTGISGLGAAYLLHPYHDITVYETNDYIGGHSRTITFKDRNRDIPVDTGFIVFNKKNYPLLTGLFEYLQVPVIKSDMSFGVCIDDGWLEYGSKGMFAQKRNLMRPRYWRMLADILRFNREASAHMDDYAAMTLRDCLDKLRMGDWFRRYYLQAMGAAIWSCSVDTILDFPARTFLQFFKNHGLLTVNDQPQWYTVKGGSREYVSRLIHGFRDRIRLRCGVQRVVREDGRVIVHDERGGQDIYDQVIFACHADQTLALLDRPDEAERSVLGAFTYQKNRVIVHRDIKFMPHNRKCWASWVYLSESQKDAKPVVSLSYWMNQLQDLQGAEPLIITLNPGREPASDMMIDDHVFDHPVFTLAAIQAQEKMETIQGLNHTWHCGAYQRYGFHEDGLLSAVSVARRLGVTPPWM